MAVAAAATMEEGSHPLELLWICAASVLGIWNVDVFGVYLAILLPMLLVQTKYALPYGIIYQLLLTMISSVKWFFQKQNGATSVNDDSIISDPSILKRKTLTVYRSSLMLLTCVAILGVDFMVYPGRFAKTECTGYSLMDLGAASFVVSAGLVRGKKPHRNGETVPWKRSLPLLGMGLLRLVTHSNLEYETSASEYGTHWNFFFTLFALTVFQFRTVSISLVATILYQFLLNAGLQTWVEDAPRSCDKRGGALCDLIVANREGLLGCISYGVLYRISTVIGRHCYWTTDLKNHSKRLWAAVLLLGFLWILCVYYLDLQVSRRSTNLSFGVWVLFVNVLQLATLFSVIKWRHSDAVPPILQQINRQGLLVFIMANLLTGAVNLSMDTFEASDSVAGAIVSVYLLVLVFLAGRLDKVRGSQQKNPTPAQRLS